MLFAQFPTWMAILGSNSFDVADVDVMTLAFGPSGASFVHSHGPHFEDVNGNGPAGPARPDAGSRARGLADARRWNGVFGCALPAARSGIATRLAADRVRGGLRK